MLTQPSGFKSYYAHFNLPRKDGRSIRLGPVGQITLKEARKRTGEIRDKAKDGIDPRMDRAARIEALKAELEKLQDEETAAALGEASRVTFKMLVDHENKEKPEQGGWYQTLMRKGNKSAKEARDFVLSTTGDWHSRPALAITEQEIERLLIGICRQAHADQWQEGAAATAYGQQAARTLAYLVQMSREEEESRH